MQGHSDEVYIELRFLLYKRQYNKQISGQKTSTDRQTDEWADRRTNGHIY